MDTQFRTCVHCRRTLKTALFVDPGHKVHRQCLPCREEVRRLVGRQADPTPEQTRGKIEELRSLWSLWRKGGGE